MQLTSERERILDSAVAGIPRVARTIAGIPTALRERALEAAERSYQQTLRDLGCQELDAQVWISAVMFRLLSEVAQHEEEGSASEAEIIKPRTAARP